MSRVKIRRRARLGVLFTLVSCFCFSSPGCITASVIEATGKGGNAAHLVGMAMVLPLTLPLDLVMVPLMFPALILVGPKLGQLGRHGN
jgi:hypothetical protein